MKRASGLRIVDKRRFTAFCTAVVLIFTGIVCAIFMGASNAVASDREYTLIYVGQGDTLWSIVKDNYPSDTDIRSAVGEIKSVNGMTTSTIYPGDALYIPVY